MVFAGDTRFGTSFICLERILSEQKAVERTVTDEEWDTWVKETAGVRSKAENAKGLAFNASWWTSVQQLVSIGAPIFKFLRVMDSDQPTMGKVR